MVDTFFLGDVLVATYLNIKGTFYQMFKAKVFSNWDAFKASLFGKLDITV